MAKPAVRQSSRLLALPGELRNRIYELAMENANNDPINLAEPQRALRESLASPTTSHDWSTFKRCFLGLTQVNRQLRQEFLPVYETYFEAGVELAELSEYLKDAILNRSSDSQEVKAKILINLTASRVNIRDLILLCSSPSMPRLVLRIDSHAISQTNLELLLFAQRNPDWLAYLTHCVSRVEVPVAGGCRYDRVSQTVNFQYKIIAIDVYIKPEFAEEWMWGGCSLRSMQAWVDWSRKLGLEFQGCMRTNVKVDRVLTDGPLG